MAMASADGATSTGTSTLGSALRSLRRNKLAMLGAAVFLALLVAGLLAPHLIPASIVRDVSFGNKLAPPDAQHWFGTDDYGRDLFSMVLLAANLDLSAA